MSIESPEVTTTVESGTYTFPSEVLGERSVSSDAPVIGWMCRVVLTTECTKGPGVKPGPFVTSVDQETPAQMPLVGVVPAILPAFESYQ